MMHLSAGFQDYYGEEAGSLLPSLTCGGERVLGEGHQKSHYLPPGGKKICQKVHKTFHSPAWQNQPDVCYVKSWCWKNIICNYLMEKHPSTLPLFCVETESSTFGLNVSATHLRFYCYLLRQWVLDFRHGETTAVTVLVQLVWFYQL